MTRREETFDEEQEQRLGLSISSSTSTTQQEGSSSSNHTTYNPNDDDLIIVRTTTQTRRIPRTRTNNNNNNNNNIDKGLRNMSLFYGFKVILFFGLSAFILSENCCFNILYGTIGFLILCLVVAHLGWYYLVRWKSIWETYKTEGYVVDGNYTKDGYLLYGTDCGYNVKKKKDGRKLIRRCRRVQNTFQEEVEWFYPQEDEPVVLIPNFPKSGRLQKDIDKELRGIQQALGYLVPIGSLSFVLVMGLVIWWAISLWRGNKDDLGDEKLGFWMTWVFNGILYIMFRLYVHYKTQPNRIFSGYDEDDDYCLVAEEPRIPMPAEPHVPLPSKSPFRKKERHYYLHFKENSENFLLLGFYWVAATIGCIVTLVQGNPDSTGFVLNFQSMIGVCFQMLWIGERNQSKLYTEYRQNGTIVDGYYNYKGYMVYQLPTTSTTTNTSSSTSTSTFAPPPTLGGSGSICGGFVTTTVHKKMELIATVEPGPVKLLVMMTIPNNFFPRSGQFEAEIDEYITLGQKWKNVLMHALVVSYGSLLILIVWWKIALLQFEGPLDSGGVTVFWIAFAVYQVCCVMTHFGSKYYLHHHTRRRLLDLDGKEEEEDEEDASATTPSTGTVDGDTAAGNIVVGKEVEGDNSTDDSSMMITNAVWRDEPMTNTAEGTVALA